MTSFEHRSILVLTILGPLLLMLCEEVAQAATTIEITEVYYDAPGADTGHEWVEVWNSSSTSILITTGSGTGSWRFFDTSNHTLSLHQGAATLVVGQTAVLTANPDQFLADYPTYSGTLFKVALSLPNQTATLKLSADRGSSYIHERSYEQSMGGAGDGRTLSWNGAAFVPSATLGGTPGSHQPPASPPPDEPDPMKLRSGLKPAPGTLPSPVADQPQLIPIATGQPQLQITEIAYNPVGSDRQEEWLEILNTGSRPVTIAAGSGSTAWRIQTSGQNHTLTNLSGPPTLGVGERLVIARDGAHFLSRFPAYTGRLAESSFSLTNSGGTIRLSTDGGATWLVEESYRPEDGGNGDGRTLERENSGGWRTNRPIGGSPGEGLHLTPPAETVKLVINEFLPRPAAGQEEWVEIYNSSPTAINLAGWTLDDRPGSGSPAYQIPSNREGGTVIQNGGYLVFPKTETGIVLADQADEVLLTSPDGVIIDRIIYGDPPRGATWIRHPPGGGWTTLPTPGGANRLVNDYAPQRVITDHGVIVQQSEPLVLADQQEPQRVTLVELPAEPGWHLVLEATVRRRTPRGFVVADGNRELRVRLPADDAESQKPHAHDRVSITGWLVEERGELILEVEEEDKVMIRQRAGRQVQPSRPVTDLLQSAAAAPLVEPPPTALLALPVAPRTLAAPPTPQIPWTNYLPVSMIGGVFLWLMNLLSRLATRSLLEI